MSEINSIANGTFTIGQTSAINFEAGPGIKVDQPSEGVVRIGNDETVLFSGEASTEITLSESPLNFTKIRVYTRVGSVNGTQNFGCGSYSEFLPYSDFNCALITGMFAGTSGSEANIYNVATKWTGTSGKNWSRTFYGFRALTATGGYSTAGNWNSPYVIVGIGRKEV